MRSRKLACPLIACTATLVGGGAPAEDGSADAWWNALTEDGEDEIAVPDGATWMLFHVARPGWTPWAHPRDGVDEAWLLASSVTHTAPPNRDWDPWRSNTAVRSYREPTDPDSPSFLPAGSSLESPWEAWEDQADSRGEWESLDPRGR